MKLEFTVTTLQGKHPTIPAFPNDHRILHSMIGTFIKEMPKEFSNSENSDLHPVKIVLPPNKSRILYFKSDEQ